MARLVERQSRASGDALAADGNVGCEQALVGLRRTQCTDVPFGDFLCQGVTAYVPDAQLGTGFGNASQDVLGIPTTDPAAQSDVSKTATPTTGLSRPPTAFIQSDQQTSAEIQDAALADWQKRVAQISLQDPLVFPTSLGLSMQLPQVVLQPGSSYPTPAKPATFDDRPAIGRQRSKLASFDNRQQGIAPSDSSLAAQNGQEPSFRMAAVGDDEGERSGRRPRRQQQPPLLNEPACRERPAKHRNGLKAATSSVLAACRRSFTDLGTGTSSELPPHSFGATRERSLQLPCSTWQTPPSQTLGPDEIKRQTVAGGDETIQVEPDWRAFQNGPLSARRNSLPVFGTPPVYADSNAGSFPFSEDTQGFPFPNAVGSLMGYDASTAWAGNRWWTPQVNLA